MAKRKFDEIGGDSVEQGESAGAKQKRVEHKLAQGVVRVGHAFKVAKGLERQKLGRRRKHAVAKGIQADVNRIDSEIAALKVLNNGTAAQQQVSKKLLKIKTVLEHPDLPPRLRAPPKHLTDAATMNVIARLCKSNNGKDALDGVVFEIQRALGLEPDGSKPLKKRRMRAKDFESATEGVIQGQSHEQAASKDRSQSPPCGYQPGTVAKSDDGSEDDFAAFDGRLAASSDEDADAIAASLSDEDMLSRHPVKLMSNGYNFADDMSISGCETDVQDSPEPRKALATKKSNFLPSLTMGGYISGSGSDLDDDIDTAPKKNRRGQQARRAIWEQKHGSQAKHLQNGNVRLDPKRGAVSDSRPRGKGDGERGVAAGDVDEFGRSRVLRKSKPSTRSGKQANPSVRPKKEHKDDGGPIHPSWEAAKRAKEKKEAPVAFQGKKITFD